MADKIEWRVAWEQDGSERYEYEFTSLLDARAHAEEWTEDTGIPHRVQWSILTRSEWKDD